MTYLTAEARELGDKRWRICLEPRSYGLHVNSTLNFVQKVGGRGNSAGRSFGYSASELNERVRRIVSGCIVGG